MSPDSRYSVGASQSLPVELDYFNNAVGVRSLESYSRVSASLSHSISLSLTDGCVAHQEFIPSLKRNLLPRVLEKIGLKKEAIDELNTGGSWVHVVLQHSKIYSHKTLRMNYTTYNIRREQDVIHIDSTHCNILLLNQRYTKDNRNKEHPYLYGMTLGVFHANVAYVGPLPENADRGRAMEFGRVDFVWVHWYDYLGSKDAFSLDRVSLCSLTSPVALDFVDPQDILRGVHLIPDFSLGKSTAPPPRFCFSRKTHDVWKAYYINRYESRTSYRPMPKTESLSRRPGLQIVISL